jgi:uncharacterized protein YndB with AHSA1/START domain
MNNKTRCWKISTIISASPEEVFTAFTNAAAFCEWLCDVAQADAHPGGRLYLWWNSGYYASGEYIILKPNEKIAFSWHGRNEPGLSRVRVTIMPDSHTTKVQLEHDYLGSGKEWRSIHSQIKRGWKLGFQNLKSVLESGIDLRFVRRPMLGVSDLQEIGREEASLLGIKNPNSLRINSLIPGLAAQNAGLQNGDVLVKFGKLKIAGFASLIGALQGKSAGDVVKVTYYRNGEKYSAQLELSPRPLPFIPATSAELADAVQQINEKDYNELMQAVDLIDEAVAEYCPGEGEWSVRQILAHLIISEQETHSWIAALIEGQEADFSYHANLASRLKAFARTFPDLPSLLAELNRSLEETAALVAALPPDFVNRRRSFWRLGIKLLEEPSHLRVHIRQINDTYKQAISSDERLLEDYHVDR